MKGKKKEQAIEKAADNTGIPKNDIIFKFMFEIKQNNIADHLIMFEWFTQGASNSLERYDTDLIENWSVKNPSAPEVLTYEKTFDPIRVDDDFAKNICSKKFYVYVVSAEDQKVKDIIYLHYSSILLEKKDIKFEFSSNKIKIPEIESFKICISSDKELLTPLYKEYLNPLQICIIGAKELPDPNPDIDKYEPSYVLTKFYDGTIIKTHELPQGTTCKWVYKQVLLTGFMDSIKLREDIRTKALTFELHDQDEIIRNDIKEDQKLADLREDNFIPLQEPIIDPKAKNQPKDKDKGKNEKAPPPKEKTVVDNKGKDKKDPKKKKEIKGFDPIKEEVKKEINNGNYGFTKILLTDFLKDNVRSLKLRGFLAPIQKMENKDFQNLDLNTTARRAVKAAHISASYLENGSYLVVAFDLSYPIGSFKRVESLKNIDSNPMLQTMGSPTGTGALNDTKKGPVGNKPGNTSEKKPPSAEAKGKTNNADDKQQQQNLQKQGNQKIPGGGGGAAQNAKTETQAQIEIDPKLKIPDEPAIYERAIYIFPYKSPELTTKLLEAVRTINLDAFDVKDRNPYYLTTKTLTEAEKNNKNLDILTGFEVIDDEFRTFMIEGLGDKGMKRLEELFPRTDPNTEKTKIMKNIDIKFKQRLYLEFNVDIKKIKLRDNLVKILMKPEIYNRNKVSENIYNTLVIINEIRRCDDLKAVVASNLFPSAESLVVIERKYGDGLSDEDINGFETTNKKIVKKTGFKGDPETMSTTNPAFNKKDQVKVTQSIEATSSISPDKSIYSEGVGIGGGGTPDQSKILVTTMNSKKMSKSVNQNSMKRVYQGQLYNLHMKADYPTDGECYPLGNQKNNIYEIQKEELRQIARNDPNNFYTYSVEYMSLSIDPYVPEDLRRKEEALKKSMWKTPDGFQTILKKTKEDYIAHPKKPPQSKIEEIHDIPWKETHATLLALSRDVRGKSMKNDFNTNVKGVKTFSDPELLQQEKLTGREKDKIAEEDKKKEYETWKQKVVTDTLHVKVSTRMSKNSQLDKIKGIREDEPKKKGLLLPDKKVKSSRITLPPMIENPPISIHMQEDLIDPGKLSHIFDRHLDMTKSISEVKFDTNIKEGYQETIIYKPTKNIFA